MAIVATSASDARRTAQTQQLADSLASIRSHAPIVGNALLSRLETGRYTVRVTPLEDHPDYPSGAPLSTVPADDLGTLLGTRPDSRHTYRQGMQVRHGGSERVPGGAGAPVVPQEFGTGRGDGSTLWYTRGVFPLERRAPVSPEEYLVHELVHAFANMQGIQDNRLSPHGIDFDYHTIGEFWSILLTNMYRSEARIGFRRWDHDPLKHCNRVDRPHARSTRGHPRVEVERTMVRQMWGTWWGHDRGLLQGLRSAPLDHNPLRDYLTPNPRHIPERAPW